MRPRAIAQLVAVVSLCIAAGDLECRPAGSQCARSRGEDLYGRMCAVCHGAAGAGYAADRAPALAQADFLASVTDVALRKAIADGRPGTTMSAWSKARGGPLDEADTDALVAMLRSWQRGPTVALDERPLAGDSGRGAPLYARECALCHGPRGLEGPEVHVGSYGFLDTASSGFLRWAIARGRPGTPMPAFEDKLGEQGIDDVIAVVRHSLSAAERSASPAGRTPPIALGPVPLHPHGPEPAGFHAHPGVTSVDVVHAQLARGARMAILDARVPSDYVAGHIAGAVSVPFYDPAPYTAALPRDAWLVCYCACPHAESGQLATTLVSNHFSKVTVLDEGVRAWEARGYPMHAGAEP